MSSRPASFVVLGDIHGHWRLAHALTGLAVAAHGPVDAVFSVGDAEALHDESQVGEVHCPAKYRHLGGFPLVASGEIAFPAPVYFIGGNHECWASLDAHDPRRPWAPGVWFLGRSGTRKIAGLSVAYLSGIFSPTISTVSGPTPARRGARGRKDQTYWRRRDIDGLTARSGPVDLLLTHEWPAGTGATTNRGEPAGQEDIARVAARLTPRLHVCGHMHHRFTTMSGRTRVECLGHIRSGADAVIHVTVPRSGALVVATVDPGSAETLSAELGGTDDDPVG